MVLLHRSPPFHDILCSGGNVMITPQRRYPTEEIVQRGKEIYQRDLRAQVEAENTGKYLAIDIETGEWEMDDSERAAGDRLRGRIPDAQTYMMRVGYDYLRRFGAGYLRKPNEVCGLTRVEKER
jgi:hypothetical protein